MVILGKEDGITRGENMQRGKKLADKIGEKRKNNEKQKRVNTETIQKK